MQTPRPAATEKRVYAPPQLQLLGSVRELTAGGSNLGFENDRFGCDNSAVGPMPLSKALTPAPSSVEARDLSLVKKPA